MGLGGLVALASVPVFRSGPFPTPSTPLRHLTPRQAGIVRALGLFLVGHGHQTVPTDVVVDGTVSAMDEENRSMFLTLLSLLEAGTFATFGRITPLSEMSYSTGIAYLEEWRRSSLSLRRTMYSAVRKTVLASWYMDPRAWPGIGYQGPWIKQFTIPPVPLRFPLKDPVQR